MTVSSRTEEKRGEAPGPQPEQNEENEENFFFNTTGPRLLTSPRGQTQQPGPSHQPHTRDEPFSALLKVKILLVLSLRVSKIFYCLRTTINLENFSTLSLVKLTTSQEKFKSQNLNIEIENFCFCKCQIILFYKVHSSLFIM